MGERTSLWAPSPSSVCTPIPWSPGGERRAPRASTQAACALHRSAGAAPAGMGLVQSSGCWWTELQRPSSLPQRTHPTPGGCGDSAGSCLGAPGAGRSRSPPLGMQSLLRMCACSCVCVFIRVSLFKKQPSLWGSWILHVRVNPPQSLAHRPSPHSLPFPHSSPPPSSAASLAVPCREKDCGKLQDSSHPSPSSCLLGLSACLPQSPGVPHTHFLSPFQQRRRKSSKPPPGSVVLPRILSFAASWLRVGGGCRWSPELRATPQSCLAPHCSCLSLSFQPQHALESSCPPEAFPMKLVSGLCSKNPSLRLPTLPPAWLDGSRPPGLTTAFRSAWVSQGPFFPVSGPSGWLWAGPSKPNLQQTCWVGQGRPLGSCRSQPYSQQA